MFIDKLRAIKKFSSIREVLIDKDLAKLGDPFVNFIYSLAKSWVLGQYSSWKVPDKVLAGALRDAKMRSLLSKKASSHDLGDAVEALLVYEWLNERITIQELVTIIYEQLRVGDLSDRIKEGRIASQAFVAVLLRIREAMK